MADNRTAPGGNGDDAAQTRISPRSPREAITPEPVPALPRSKSVRNPLVVALNALLTLAMLAILAVGGLLYWGKTEFDAPGPLATETAVLIPPSSGLTQIADLLEGNGVIADRYVFMGGVWAYRQSRNLKAGEYAFPANISMREAMDLIVSGKAILHTVTLPEGLTSKQIVDRLLADDTLTGDVATIPKEGTLLPETYSFTRGTTRQQILDQMAAAHKRVLAAVWEQRRADLPIRTPEEMVTLASIVEKETGVASERPHVASVFINRLNKGMRLQSDPTIIYGIVRGNGTLGRPIRRSDIDTPTPYNTYTIDGLPPGPIANPGRAALEAVARPDETDDLYFVADGTGGHAFASTLDEHNRNVARWREIERRGGVVAPAEDATADAPEPTAGPDSGADSGAASDPLDLLEGRPARDPDTPLLPLPKPAG